MKTVEEKYQKKFEFHALNFHMYPYTSKGIVSVIILFIVNQQKILFSSILLDCVCEVSEMERELNYHRISHGRFVPKMAKGMTAACAMQF